MSIGRLGGSLEKRWRPPFAPMIKFNTDAAFSQGTEKGFIEIHGRDKHGTLISPTSMCILASSSLTAEALGLRETGVFSRNLKILHASFESNNLLVIEACRGKNIKRDIRGIIEDVKFLKQSFNHCAFTWVSREGNMI